MNLWDRLPCGFGIDTQFTEVVTIPFLYLIFFTSLSYLISYQIFLISFNMCPTHVYLPFFILTVHAAHLPSNACRTCFYLTFSSFPTCVPHMFLTIYTVDNYTVTLVYSLFDSSSKDSELTQKGYLLLEHKRRTSQTRT